MKARFRDLFTDTVTLDDFVESEHPRGPDGKFSANPSGGAAGYKITQTLSKKLEALGFSKMKGLMAYEGPGGIKIAIGGPHTGQIYSSNWTSYKPGSKTKSGEGAKEVEALLKSGVDKELTKQFEELGFKSAPESETKPPSTFAQAQEFFKGSSGNSAPLYPSKPETWEYQPVDLSKLKTVGGKLGSNEAAVMEDAEGKKYYVKTPIDEVHAKNEVLAAKLYQLAGVNTLKYRNGGANKVVTEWQKFESKADGFDSVQKELLREQFAIHAWLSNWDVVGVDLSNQMGTEGGDIVTTDPGGSLLFRAQGKAKTEEQFGNKVAEWDTMRNASTAPQASKFFANMTKEELQTSVARLKGISDEDIVKLVSAVGPFQLSAGNSALAAKLIARKEDLIKKAADLDKPAPTPPPAPTFEHVHANPHTTSPEPTHAEKKAVQAYSGSHYQQINQSMRKGSASELAAPLKAYLDKCQIKQDMVVSRKVSGAYSEVLKSIAAVGMRFQEKAFMSTSISHEAWHGDLHMKISVKAGQKGSYIKGMSNHPGENELLIQAGSYLTIKKIEGHVWHVELEQ